MLVSVLQYFRPTQNRHHLRLRCLEEILPRIWSRESSGFPDLWTPENPSCGQCYPTARLIQVLFGGELIHQRLEFDDGVWDHFVNQIDEVRYDLSADQMDGEMFTVMTDRLFTERQGKLFESKPELRRMVDTLFQDFSQRTGITATAAGRITEVCQ